MLLMARIVPAAQQLRNVDAQNDVENLLKFGLKETKRFLNRGCVAIAFWLLIMQ